MLDCLVDELLLLGRRHTPLEPHLRTEHASVLETLVDFWCLAEQEFLHCRLPLERVPYPADVAINALKWVEHLVLVNAKAPVGFFAYPGKPSKHYPETAQVHFLTRYEHDAEAALQALCEELNAPAVAMPDVGKRPERARGAPSPEGLARTVAALMPENAIIADESVSYGRGFFPETFAAPKHDWLQITGGAIGIAR